MHPLRDTEVLLSASFLTAEGMRLVTVCGMTLHIFSVLSSSASPPLLSPKVVGLVGNPLSSSFLSLIEF